MPKFIQTLRKEMVSFLIPFPHSSSTVALKLFSLTLAKARFVSHINFIGCCLQAKVIPIGFRVKFNPSNFGVDSAKYFSDVSSASKPFSRSVMHSTIRAICAGNVMFCVTPYLIVFSILPMFAPHC